MLLETNGANGNILGDTASEGFLGSRSLTLGRIRGARGRWVDVCSAEALKMVRHRHQCHLHANELLRGVQYLLHREAIILPFQRIPPLP